MRLGPSARSGVGIAAYFLLIGLLADSVTQFLGDNPQFAQQAAQAGFVGLGTIEGYVSAVFTLLAVPTPASTSPVTRRQLRRRDRAEADTHLRVARLESPLAGCANIRRAAGGTALTAAAGVATWLGTALVGASLGFVPALAGALNTLPVMTVSLGTAVLALGWLPEAVFAVGSLPAVGGFLVQSLVGGLGWPRCAADLSPFTHLATVPSVRFDRAGTGLLVLVGVALAWLGALGYARRDLRG